MSHENAAEPTPTIAPATNAAETSDLRTVVVVCGSGAATSFVVAKKITEYLRAQGIEADVVPVKVADLGEHAHASVIVATAEVPSHITTPIIGGLPLLTGIGENGVLEAVATHLKAGTDS